MEFLFTRGFLGGFTFNSRNFTFNVFSSSLFSGVLLFGVFSNGLFFVVVTVMMIVMLISFFVVMVVVVMMVVVVDVFNFVVFSDFFNLLGFFNNLLFFDMSSGGFSLDVEGRLGVETFRSGNLDDLSLEGGIFTSNVRSQFSDSVRNSSSADIVENVGEVESEVGVGVVLVGILSSEEELSKLRNDFVGGNSADGSGSISGDGILFFSNSFSSGFNVESCNII